MDFDTYQKGARETATYPEAFVRDESDGTLNRASFLYAILGLTGEASEVAEKLGAAVTAAYELQVRTGKVAEHAKKIVRDRNGVLSVQDRASLAKELGDVLWYVSDLATDLDLSLDDIASGNLAKLLSRQERGVLNGNGDDR